jgi:hypothetical protein
VCFRVLSTESIYRNITENAVLYHLLKTRAQRKQSSLFFVSKGCERKKVREEEDVWECVYESTAVQFATEMAVVNEQNQYLPFIAFHYRKTIQMIRKKVFLYNNECTHTGSLSNILMCAPSVIKVLN